jgi:hypothetical protein
MYIGRNLLSASGIPNWFEYLTVVNTLMCRCNKLLCLLCESNVRVTELINREKKSDKIINLRHRRVVLILIRK